MKKKDLSTGEKIKFVIMTYGIVLVFAMNIGVDAKTAGLYALWASLFIIFCIIYSFFTKDK